MKHVPPDQGLVMFDLAKAMSALENIVRVNSEKQTLILAGERAPRPGVTDSLAVGSGLAYADSRRRVTLVATPVTEPMLLVQGHEFISGLAPFTSNLVASLKYADRGSSYGGAYAYARTQQLSGAGARTAIIDTYA